MVLLSRGLHNYQKSQSVSRRPAELAGKIEWCSTHPPSAKHPELDHPNAAQPHQQTRHSQITSENLDFTKHNIWYPKRKTNTTCSVFRRSRVAHAREPG